MRSQDCASLHRRPSPSSTAGTEDAVHDLFVGLPHHLARYDERGRFGPWLRATAIGIARMQLRKANRRATVLARDAQGADDAATTCDPSLGMDVERAVSRLSDPLRAVFVLRQWEGFSHDEIATMLDITPGASRLRHARALDHLRAQLDR
jgi:RNA polymerase sigma factor (sigma-70 family)